MSPSQGFADLVDSTYVDEQVSDVLADTPYFCGFEQIFEQVFSEVAVLGFYGSVVLNAESGPYKIWPHFYLRTSVTDQAA